MLLLKSHRRGFTLIELLLVIGIIGTLATITIIAINPQKQLLAANDAKRVQIANQVEKAFSQYLIDKKGTLPSAISIPSGVSNATPICRTDGVPINCLNVDFLTPTYIASMGLDDTEPCSAFSGYKAYKDGSFIKVVAANIGKTASQITIDPNCPTAVAGTLKMWLKADAITGIADGATVTTWTDKSGNGNSPTQVTPGIRPIYRANQFNGKPVMEMSINNRMDTPTSFTSQQAYIVYKAITTPFNGYGAVVGVLSGSRAFVFENAQTYFHSNPFPLAAYKNGVALSSPFNMAPITSPMLLTVNLANPTSVRQYQIGASENGYGAPLYIAEILLFDSILSAPNQAAIQNYLNVKYALY